jgi:homoserine dehydrogenase
MKPLRIWLVGFGTVGQWLVRALDSQAERLARRFGIAVTLVGLANARDGFIYDADGIDPRSVLALASRGGSIAEQPRVASDGEPGLAHMREALERRIPVVTSNKWPVALGGAELAALARDHQLHPLPDDGRRVLRRGPRGGAARGPCSEVEEATARGARLKQQRSTSPSPTARDRSALA